MIKGPRCVEDWITAAVVALVMFAVIGVGWLEVAEIMRRLG